ncbi:MAG: DUF3343 domain-containing protein [Oscillibacter sp.]|nr:DUF3343 domain-containing protein [Oscillibacter sp.]
MREKHPYLVVTFHTTSAAMAAEQSCRRAGLAGKLISVPRCLTSDCGIAWRAPEADRSAVEAQLREDGVEVADLHILML